MKGQDLGGLDVSDLVERFVDICIEQSKALFDDDVKRFNDLYDQMAAIDEQLKSRSGDQRQALLTLLNHRDLQVRLQAAKATLAVAPLEARRTIEAIADSRRNPQAGDAGMCLWAIDEGIFKPE